MKRKWLGFFSVLAAVLAATGLARSQEPIVVGTGVCIGAVAGAGSTAGGIAMPGLEREAYVRRCDDRWFRVVARDAAAELVSDDAGPQLSPAIVADPGMLADGEITTGSGRVRAAWLTGPTEIYGHGILGDRVEATGFRVVDRDGKRYDLGLDQRSVFEDLRVRLVDLTGDGADEFVVIRSTLDGGAALAVYRLGETGIEPVAESLAIGQPNRWLNPAGAADFDGDGVVEIAHVETPHIGGVLRVYELGGEGLKLEHSAAGFSNHAIGSRVLDMSAVVDWNADGVPDLALPDAARRRMRIVTLAGGAFADLAEIPHDARIATAVIATDLDADGAPELVYGLDDGTIVLARPSESSARSFGKSWMFAAATFSSRWASDDVPGIGSIAGERASSQAIAIWAGVAL